MSTSGIFFKQHFFTPENIVTKNQNYSGLVTYINKENNISIMEKIDISKSEREEICNIFKNKFNTAQKDGKNLWHGVVSFKTDYLKKYGVINNEGKINDSFLRGKIVLAYKNLLTKEKIDFPNFIIALHTDTKNFHYHIGFTTNFDTRLNGEEEKGKFKLKNIRAFKAEIVNEITNAREINLEINKIKSKLKESMKTNDTYIELINNDLIKLYKTLPQDCNLSQWKYNSNKLAPYRNEIDCLSQKIIDKYFKNDFSEYVKHAEKLEKLYKKSYGDSNNNFTNNKIQELYAYLGNAILKECRKLKRTEKYLAEYQKEKTKRKNMKFTNRNLSIIKNHMIKYFSNYKSREMFMYELETKKQIED